MFNFIFGSGLLWKRLVNISDIICGLQAYLEGHLYSHTHTNTPPPRLDMIKKIRSLVKKIIHSYPLLFIKNELSKILVNLIFSSVLKCWYQWSNIFLLWIFSCKIRVFSFSKIAGSSFQFLIKIKGASMDLSSCRGALWLTDVFPQLPAVIMSSTTGTEP